MKRLKLDDFKSKNFKEENALKIDQLLGQVLGDCHASQSGLSKFSNITIKR
ncbi:MAG: hypothetical protein AB8E82_01825 [Aureispira sp.]